MRIRLQWIVFVVAGLMLVITFLLHAIGPMVESTHMVIQVEQESNSKTKRKELFPPKKSTVQERLASGKYDENTEVLHVVSHTHWDREWYLPFEKFRRSLVQITDHVWEILATDPDFYHWHNDGQISVVEDYLEIRPHMVSHVREASSKNMYSLGPWYTQPDEFLVSGEALVRNLMLGIKLAIKFGKPLKIGYLPDTFGHISQLPQVLLGFGIDSAMMTRGIRHTGIGMPSELNWTGADGSTIYVTYLASFYCNALFHHRVSAEHNDTQMIKWFSTKRQKILKEHSQIRHAILLNGCDHTGVDYDVGAVVKRADKLLSEAFNVRVVHSSLEEFLEIARAEIRDKGLVLSQKSGELFTGRDVQIDLVNVYSTQIHQKQENWRVQSSLEKYSEPLNAVMWCYAVMNHTYDMEMFWYTWKLLLQNHPHDSIAGCSSPDVHRDVEDRFARAKQVSDSLFSEAFTKLMRVVHIGTDVNNPKIIVFNPLAMERRNELVVVRIDFPVDVNITRLHMTDSDGNHVPCTLLHVPTTDYGDWDFRLPNKGFRKGFRPWKRVKIGFLTTFVPAVGYNTFTVSTDQPSDPPPPPAITSSKSTISNKFLSVDVLKDGSLTIRNNLIRETFTELNMLRFCSDYGSEYIANPSACTGPSGQAEIRKVTETSFYQSIEVTVTHHDMTVNVSYLLLRDSKHVDVYVAVFNNKHNHRIQASFGTLPPEHDLITDNQYDVVNHSSSYNFQYHAQQNFVAYINKERNVGVLVANRGLPEVSVEGGKMMITLLRSVDRVGDWGDFPAHTAQVQGMHRFEYRVVPFSGLMEATQLGRMFNSPLMSSQILDYGTRGPQSHAMVKLDETELYHVFNKITYDYSKGGGSSEDNGEPLYPRGERAKSLPGRYSFLQLQPATKLVLSAVKRADTRPCIIVRYYNPTDEPLHSTLTLPGISVDVAYLCALSEERKHVVQPDEMGLYAVAVEKKQIITLELCMAK